MELQNIAMEKTIKPPFQRTAYNYDRNAAGDESGLDCSAEKSLTHQSFAEEVDINTIVRKFGVTGELPTGIRMPTYGDFDQVNDFQSAMNAIAQANEAFDAMPAEIRARFGNDPDKFVQFCSDDRNRPEAERMGLVLPKVVTAPPKELTEALNPPIGEEKVPPKGVT